MRYKLFGLVIVFLVSLSATSSVQAQSSDDSSSGKDGLNDRFKQFREDLFGTGNKSDRSSTQNSRSSRKPNSRSRSGNSSSQRSRPTPVTARNTKSSKSSGVVSGRTPRRTRPTNQKTTELVPEVAPPSVSIGSASADSGSSAAPFRSRTSSRRMVSQDKAASPFSGQAARASDSARVADQRAEKPATAKQLKRTATPRTSAPAAAPSVVKSKTDPAPVSTGPASLKNVNRKTTPTSVVRRKKVARPVRVADDEGDEAVLFAHKSPLLRVETLGPRSTVVGKMSTYKVRIQNLGDVEANGVTVRVNVPKDAEVTVGNASRGAARAQADGELQWTIDRLEGRTHEELLLKITPRGNQQFNLAVNWSCSAVQSQAKIEVQEPKLDLELVGPKEILFGESKVYRLEVSNPGTGDAENVTIQLMPINGGSQPAAKHNLGTIAAGEDRVLEVELTARQAGQVVINASVVADGDLRDAVETKVLVRRAGLKVDLAGPGMKYAGTIGSYTLRVGNPGNATADRVRISAVLPSGAKHLTSSHGGKYDDATGKVQWLIDELPAGKQRELVVKYTLNKAGENHLKITAEAEGDLSDQGSMLTRVEATADLKLDVSDPTGPIAVGEDLVYEVRIRNRGTKSAEQVEVFAFLGEGLVPVLIENGQGQIDKGRIDFKEIGVLDAGEEKVFKVVAKAQAGGNHVFHAELRCQTLGTRLVAEESTLFYETQASSAPANKAYKLPAQSR